MEQFPIYRNTVLLAATLTCLSGMVQLTVAVATVNVELFDTRPLVFTATVTVPGAVMRLAPTEPVN